MTTVAITGVNGLVGRRLLAALRTRADIDRIIGLDITAPPEAASADPASGPEVTFVAADVRDPDIEQHLEGVDVLVHLAFMLDPIRDETTMKSVNVGGTINVLSAGHAAGVRRFVYLSSGVVYGAHPDNAFPLTEDAPRRPNPDFNYAEHKGQVEEWLWSWVDGQPDVTLTVLRPAIIGGPGVDNFITRQLEYPRFVAVRGHRPPWQFVHVDDVISAIGCAIDTPLPGAFNVACDGWLSFDEVLGITGARTLEVPEEVAFSAVERLWKRGLAHAPAGQLHYVMHPWVLSVDRLRAAGWRPTHTNRDVLAGLTAEHASHVTLPGGPRLERRTVRTVAVASGVAATGVVAALIARRVRRTPRT